MTATATRIACPVDGCTYSVDNEGSIPAHVAMAHPGAAAKPKRSARNGHTAGAVSANPPAVAALHAAELLPYALLKDGRTLEEAIVAGDASVPLLGTGR